MIPLLVLAIGGLAGAWLRLRWAFENGLWRDEVQFLTIASSPTVGELLNFLAEHESHPPLYYLLARGWGAVAGWSDGAAYLPSLVLGLATLGSMAAVAWRLGGRGAGVLALLFGAVSSTLIIDAGMVRPYAGLSLAVLWSAWLAWQVACGAGRRHAAGWVILALALVYTHNWAWLVVGAQGLLLLLVAPGSVGRRLKRGLVLGGLVVAGYLPWLPTLLGQIRNAGYPALPYSEVPEWLGRALEALVGLPLVVAVVPAAIAAIAAAVELRSERRSRERLAPAGFFLGMVLLSVVAAVGFLPVTNLLISQCFAMLTPVFLTGLALLLREIRSGRGLPSAAAQVLWITASVLQWAVIGGLPKTNVRELAAAVAAQATTLDLIIVMPVYSAPPFGRYYQGPGRVETFPDGGLPMAVYFDRRPERNARPGAAAEFLAAADSASRRGGRIWLVATDAPAHDLLDRVATLRRDLAARFGAPTPIRIQTRRRAMYEGFEVEVYGTP